MGIPISILIGKIVIATISLPLLTRTRTASLEVTSSDVEATSLPITFPSMLYFEFREPDDEKIQRWKVEFLLPETKKGKANCLVDSSMNSRQFTLVTKVKSFPTQYAQP
jgi:hypothetical protein